MLIMAILVMMVISIYQYSWSLFAFALARELKWNMATIGLTFTIFAYSATFIQPFSGYVADFFGPRKVSILAAGLTGLGFILSSWARTPMELYVFYGLGSLGVGILYGLSTASAIKWFPEKRGFATGLVVFGFGAGTALFNWVIQDSLDLRGFRLTFLYLGFFMLVVLVPAAFFYKYPPAQWKPSSAAAAKKASATATEFRPAEMVRTYQWFLIYFCFSFTVSIVLMFGAQMKMLAKEYRLPEDYFNALLVLFPPGKRVEPGGSRGHFRLVGEREDDDDLLRPPGSVHHCPAEIRGSSVYLCGHYFPRRSPGRISLCSVSGDSGGLLWGQVFDGELWDHLHRQSMGRFHLRLVERVFRHPVGVLPGSSDPDCHLQHYRRRCFQPQTDEGTPAKAMIAECGLRNHLFSFTYHSRPIMAHVVFITRL